MPSFRRATVTGMMDEREGLQRVRVDGERAYVLTDLTGPVAVGDDVIVNTTAVELGLGTGGWHIVHWNLSRDAWSVPGRGHIMKLRYTSLQVDTGAAEENDVDLPDRLDGRPVVACSLHSQVGVVAATIADLRPGTRVVYVMTDGAALPMALSDLVAEMRAHGLLHATVTVGHAFGGDHEAVALPSGLLVAAAVGAEVVLVGMGPGVVGTGTAFGTTATEVAGVLDTAAALGGRPIVCVRASEGDTRGRHRGTSHHTRTALALTHTRPTIPVAPELDDAPDGSVVVEVPDDVGAVLDRIGLDVRTMGRGPAEDPLFFRTSAAAGVAAAAALPQ